MNKAGILLLLWALFFVDIADADQWVVRFGGSRDDAASSIQQTTDGGYVVAGWTDSFGTGDFDVWVLKLNANGSVIWQKTYGGSRDDAATSVQQTTDGGYVVAGESHSFGGDRDVWVLKLNANGSVSWQRTYGGSRDDAATSIEQTTDSGYIVAGRTESFGIDDRAVWVLKLNADGSVSWQKTYDDLRRDEATSIQQTTDGGYVVAGYSSSFGAGGGTAWVLKADRNGSIGSCGAFAIAESSAVSTSTSIVSSDSSAAIASASVSLVTTGVLALASDAVAIADCSRTPPPISTACAATLSSDFKLHVPIIDFQGTTFRADFRHVPNTLDFVLTDADVVLDDSSFDGCAHSVLSNDLTLVLPDIRFNGKSYWAQLTRKEGARLTLTAAGEN